MIEDIRRMAETWDDSEPLDSGSFQGGVVSGVVKPAFARRTASVSNPPEPPGENIVKLFVPLSRLRPARLELRFVVTFLLCPSDRLLVPL
jgi:hypothetical protein|tara:strand:- start:1015 stop:1284 length:270 start_codon:yes stop_codon:yes gene_type:complete